MYLTISVCILVLSKSYGLLTPLTPSDFDVIKPDNNWLGFTKHFFIKCETIKILIMGEPTETLGVFLIKDFHEKMGRTFVMGLLDGKCENEGYILLIPDLRSLMEAVDGDYHTIFPNSRGNYAIFYDSGLTDCKTATNASEKFIRTVWEKLNIINLVLIIVPCKDHFVYGPALKIIYSNIKPFKFGTNFNKQPIRCTLFERDPTAVFGVQKYVNEDLKVSGGFGGLDGMVLVNMAKYLNFTPIPLQPSDGIGYGWRTSHGFVGSLGDVIYKRTDISNNGRFVMNYKTEDIQFTHFVRSDELCVIVPKAKEIPQWLMVFHCFSFATWSIILATFFFTWFAWYHVRWFPKSTGKSATVAFIETLSVMFSIPFRLHEKFSRRIFLAGCMGFNVITVGIFQGSLVTSFSVTSYYEDVTSLQMLQESSFPISTHLEVFGNDTELMRSLNNKRITSDYNSSLDRAAYFGDVAAVERRGDAEFLMKTVYISDDGSPLLYIVPDCPSTNYLAYIVHKDCPYLPAFNSALKKFWEAGLLDKWYRDVVDFTVMSNIYRKSLKINEDVAFTMSNVQTAFYILFLGLSLSLVVIFGEILNFRFLKRN